MHDSVSNNIKIYHSREFSMVKVRKLGRNDKYTRVTQIRVTLAYMFVKNAVYITAARCSERDQFSRKEGASRAKRRMREGKYAVVVQFSNLLNYKSMVIDEILDTIAYGIAEKDISVK